jgi:hypothetical protein
LEKIKGNGSCIGKIIAMVENQGKKRTRRKN